MDTQGWNVVAEISATITNELIRKAMEPTFQDLTRRQLGVTKLEQQLAAARRDLREAADAARRQARRNGGG